MRPPVRLFPLLLAALTACSNTSNDDQLLRDALTPASQSPVPRAKALFDAGAPRLQVAFPANGKSGVMVLEGRRDGIDTWLSSDGATLILDHGMLRGTRGFGGGMLASDISRAKAMILSGHQGPSLRFHTFLKGDDRAITRSYKCVIENRGARTVDLGTHKVATQLVAETCRSTDQKFQNLYWVSGAGHEIIQSSQWTGDFLGNVSIRVLR